MAHTYSHLFKLPTTGLRFFTVYGPWGRPDMALYMFTKAILSHEPIVLFNEGKHNRDFTYVDDIVSSIIKLIDLPPIENQQIYKASSAPSVSIAPWRILNIGNSETVSLLDFVSIIEDCVGVKAIKSYDSFQLGDVESSYASTQKLYNITGFKPYTPLREGIKNFVDWYKSYHRIG